MLMFALEHRDVASFSSSPKSTNYLQETTMEDHHHSDSRKDSHLRRSMSSNNVDDDNKKNNDNTSTTTTGLFGTSANLVNTIVGAGIIGIPFAVEQSGLIIGLLLLILVSWMTAQSLQFIVALARHHPQLAGKGIGTFEDLMAIPFGPTGKTFMLISMFVYAYGAMVAYLIVIKDSVPTIIGYGDTVGQQNLVMLITSLVFIVPLSLMRDMSQLAFTSFVSVLADVVLIGIVVWFSPVARSVQDAGGLVTVATRHWIDARVFIGLGVLSTAMACQHSAFLIANSLSQPTPRRWTIVTQSSLAVAGFLSILLGLVGYLGFLEHTQGDILNNLQKDSTYVNAARGLLALTMVFTYPMETFVARHVLSHLWPGSTTETARRYTMTIALYIGSLVPALIFHDLGLVLSLTGTLGAGAVAYIGPGMVYLGVNGQDFLDWVYKWEKSCHYSMDETAGTAIIAGEVELPISGDRTAMMQTDDAVAGYYHFLQRKKPWWWWPLAMPIWVAIATRGARGTNAFLADYSLKYDGNPPPLPTDDAVILVIPQRRNYVVACLFIAFGVVAAVCGLASNIYVQIHGVFFTP